MAALLCAYDLSLLYHCLGLRASDLCCHLIRHESFFGEALACRRPSHRGKPPDYPFRVLQCSVNLFAYSSSFLQPFLFYSLACQRIT